MIDTKLKTTSSIADFLPHHLINKIEEKFCVDHQVPFEEVTCRFGASEIITGCQLCLEDEMQQQSNERQQQVTRENQARKHAALLKATHIPGRFKDARFDNYEVASDAHKQRTLNSLLTYATDFEAARFSGASMILAGLPGTGKTHLAAALAHQLVESGYQPRYTTAQKLFRFIRDTYNRNSRQTTQEVMDQLAELDLLIIDEIGVQRGTDDELNLLFEVIDDRYNNRAPTLLISNLGSKALEALIGDRVIDRLRDNGGKYLAFNWESYRGNKRPKAAK